VRELGRIATEHDDYRTTSASIQVPTLVMQGNVDSVVPIEKAKAMADRIPTLGSPGSPHRTRSTGWSVPNSSPTRSSDS